MIRDISTAIAWRYLHKDKTKGAVGTISTVSVCAMAVATAAIICVLSVFNGFREIISSRLDTLCPDIEVMPAKGKVFHNADSIARAISIIPGVAVASPTLSDNALIISNGHEMPVTLKGVSPEDYARITRIKDLIAPEFGTYFRTADSEPAAEEQLFMAPAISSIGVASRMRVMPDDKLLVFAPRREGRVNMANPLASFITDSLEVRGVYRSDQQEYDDDGVIVPIGSVRRLLQYTDEASAIEISVNPGTDASRLVEKIGSELGDGFIVKDRLRQQEMNFRMIAIEKWVSFLLLGFILLIASFNCISALSMLVIEKEGALSTFKALGMSRRMIGHIFAAESIFVALAGGLSGLAVGVILCLLQQHFGFIKLGGDPGAISVSAYPVKLEWTDLIITLAPVLIIGLLTAAITAGFARQRVSSAKIQ